MGRRGTWDAVEIIKNVDIVENAFSWPPSLLKITNNADIVKLENNLNLNWKTIEFEIVKLEKQFKI